MVGFRRSTTPSMAYASRSSEFSSQGRAMSCNPIGIPVPSYPAGTVIAGSPLRFAGLTNLITSITWLTSDFAFRQTALFNLRSRDWSSRRCDHIGPGQRGQEVAYGTSANALRLNIVGGSHRPHNSKHEACPQSEVVTVFTVIAIHVGRHLRMDCHPVRHTNRQELRDKDVHQFRAHSNHFLKYPLAGSDYISIGIREPRLINADPNALKSAIVGRDPNRRLCPSVGISGITSRDGGVHQGCVLCCGCDWTEVGNTPA